MPTDPRLAALVAAVALAFAVETALGFGATVVAVSLGALFFPIEIILPAFVPLNIVLSAKVFVQSRRDVAWRTLFLGTLPWMVLGLPFGMFAFNHLDPGRLRRGFGAFLVVLAAMELLRSARKATDAHLPRVTERALLLFGGIVHGAFATGGPMVVYVLGRSIKSKETLRGTMALLWLIMNSILVVQFAIAGQLTRYSVALSIPLGIGLLAGMFGGEILFAKVPEKLFHKLVFGLLLVAGMVLMR